MCLQMKRKTRCIENYAHSLTCNNEEKHRYTDGIKPFYTIFQLTIFNPLRSSKLNFPETQLYIDSDLRQNELNHKCRLNKLVA